MYEYYLVRLNTGIGLELYKILDLNFNFSTGYICVTSLLI